MSSDQKEIIDDCICYKTAEEIVSICQELQEWALDLLERFPGLDGEILLSLNSVRIHPSAHHGILVLTP